MKLSEQTKIEAQIGGMIGLIIGLIGAATVIVLFAAVDFWLKFWTIIGMGSAVFMQAMGLSALLKMRKAHIEGLKMMEQIQKDQSEVKEHSEVKDQDKGGSYFG